MFRSLYLLYDRVSAFHKRIFNPPPGVTEPDDFELPEDLSPLISKISQDAVAQGAFGDVWKCHLSYKSRNIKNVDVAVKVLRILPHDDEGKKDVRREMGIWRRMRHRHIVPFFGVANNFIPSRISLVSPWQANGTLTSLLECDYNMNYMRRLLLLQDIASGLCYLHGEHVVHGDLTGTNVLIDTDGSARLTDFGLSSVVNAGENMTYLAITTRRPGAIRWVAPELVVEDIHMSPTFCSDIYSYGSVMLQTLSGQLPWSEIKNPTTIIIKLYEKCLPRRPESLRMLDAHWDFIMLCMNLVAESRPSAVEVLEWVNNVISSFTVHNSAGPETESPPLHPRMALNNYLQSKFGASVGEHVRLETWTTGPPNEPTWHTSIYIDDMVYGVGQGHSKGAASDRAADQALNRLLRES